MTLSTTERPGFRSPRPQGWPQGRKLIVITVMGLLGAGLASLWWWISPLEYRAEVMMEILAPRPEAKTTAPGEAEPKHWSADRFNKLFVLTRGTVSTRVGQRLTPAQKIRLIHPYRSEFSPLGPENESELRYDLLDSHLDLTLLPGLSVIKISYRHADQNLAEAVARLFAEEYIQAYIDLSTEQARRAIEQLKIDANGPEKAAYQKRIQDLMNLIQTTLEPARIIESTPAKSLGWETFLFKLSIGGTAGLVGGVFIGLVAGAGSRGHPRLRRSLPRSRQQP